MNIVIFEFLLVAIAKNLYKCAEFDLVGVFYGVINLILVAGGRLKPIISREKKDNKGNNSTDFPT